MAEQKPIIDLMKELAEYATLGELILKDFNLYSLLRRRNDGKKLLSFAYPENDKISFRVVISKVTTANLKSNSEIAIKFPREYEWLKRHGHLQLMKELLEGGEHV